MHQTLRPALGCLVLALAACQSPPPGDPPAPLRRSLPPSPSRQPSGIIQVGDVLEIIVPEDATLNGQVTVLESGNIVLPKLGRVQAAGHSLTAFQDFVRDKVQSEQVKKASVIVERVYKWSGRTALAETPKMLIFITGAVSRPGQHRIALQDENGTTALEALLIAGGPTMFADQRRSYILRKTGSGQRFRIPVDLRAVSKGEAIDPQLQEGDIIFVPGRRFGL